MEFSEIAVWWTSGDEMRILGKYALGHLPEYIARQFRSRLGRNGRGRLWVEGMFGDVAIDLWSGSPLGEFLAMHCGGIVIRRDDIHCLADIPGTITDLKLQRI